MKKNKILLLAGCLVLLIAGFSPFGFAQHVHNGQEKSVKTNQAKKIYYCPMHPNYTSDHPGDCPICNMKLVLKEDEPVMPEAKHAEEGAVYIDSRKQQLIGVKTDKATVMPLTKNIRTTGIVAFDPELYKTQAEYVQASKRLKELRNSGQEELIKRSEDFVEAISLKLGLLGLSKEQIEALAKNKEIDKTLLISSEEGDFSWIYGTIYEYEMGSVKTGQEAVVKAISYPDKEFKGTIVAINPVLDQETRSVKARIKVENAQGLLKPNMYVDIDIKVDLGEALVVNKEAIMDSGLRKMVFLSLPDGYFKPKEIKTGFSNDDYVQVTEGLSEGDNVVVSGNFLIDSESKLKAALEGTGHQHGQ